MQKGIDMMICHVCESEVKSDDYCTACNAGVSDSDRRINEAYYQALKLGQTGFDIDMQLTAPQNLDMALAGFDAHENRWVALDENGSVSFDPNRKVEAL